jgi:DNA-binding NarL/FixJ family response regulator
MRERLELLGGSLRIESRPGRRLQRPRCGCRCDERGRAASGSSWSTTTPSCAPASGAAGAHDQLEVVGEADSGEAALAQVHAANPDVMLLDLSLPGMSGIATARALREASRPCGWWPCRCTRTRSTSRASSRRGVGVRAEVVGRDAAARRHHGGVARRVLRPRRLLAELAREMAHADPYRQVQLTPRELEVVRQIAQGHTYREIAEELGISEKTVATYRERASVKLGVRSRAELVRWALENDLLD